MTLTILWSILAVFLTAFLGFFINRFSNLEKDIKYIRDTKVENLRKDFEEKLEKFDEKLEKKAEKLDDRIRTLEEKSWRTVKDEGSTVSLPK